MHVTAVSGAATIHSVTVTLDVPPEAQARLEAEAAPRGTTLNQDVAEIAGRFPAGTPVLKNRLSTRLPSPSPNGSVLPESRC